MRILTLAALYSAAFAFAADTTPSLLASCMERVRADGAATTAPCPPPDLSDTHAAALQHCLPLLKAAGESELAKSAVATIRRIDQQRRSAEEIAKRVSLVLRRPDGLKGVVVIENKGDAPFRYCRDSCRIWDEWTLDSDDFTIAESAVDNGCKASTAVEEVPPKGKQERAFTLRPKNKLPPGKYPLRVAFRWLVPLRSNVVPVLVGGKHSALE